MEKKTKYGIFLNKKRNDLKGSKVAKEGPYTSRITETIQELLVNEILYKLYNIRPKIPKGAMKNHKLKKKGKYHGKKYETLYI